MLGLLAYGLVRVPGQGPSASSVLTVLGFSYALGAPIGYAATLAGGGAWLLWQRRTGRPPHPAVAGIVGAAMGAGIAAALAPSLEGELFSIPFPCWAGALLGTITAEIFRRLLPRQLA